VTGDRAVRADARLNRERIIAAARELYAEEGGDVSFSAVAERAGVGNATLYRHFATQDDLRDAVYLARIGEATELLVGLAELDDATEALRRYLTWVFETADLSLFGRVADGMPRSAAVEEAALRMRELLDGLVRRAHADASLSAELDCNDVLVAAAALVRITRHARIPRERAARFLDVVLRGLGLAE
jgi:AcrR family transcriptional regulator